MKRYDFNRLIRAYSLPFTVSVPGEGHYEAGDWIPGQEEIRQCSGAILPFSAKRLYESGGTLSAVDRQLFTPSPLPGDVNQIKLTYKDQSYTVEPDSDYSDYGDVCIYLLKAVIR